MNSIKDLDMNDWHCPDHPEGLKEFDGEHWTCIECGEPLTEKAQMSELAEIVQAMINNNTPIDKLDGPFAFMSNFEPAKVVIGGLLFDTIEHGFQAAKSFDPEDWEKIQACATPGQAKRMGRKVTLRPDWEEAKIPVMEELLRQKFSNPKFKEMLEETRGLQIIEGNKWHDNFWGDCECKKCVKKPGQNNLGKLLMKIREEGLK